MDSQFAIVELLGRQRFGAKVQEEEFCGAKLLHCDVLTDPPYARMVNPTALYALTPCTEERAKLACRFLASPFVVRSNPPRASLPAPGDPFDDVASDDIPFGDDRPEDPEEDDDVELILEEFECEQCKSQLTERLDEGMCLPEGWAGVPAGWSLIARGPDDDVYFCSESCVRDFLNKPQTADESTEDVSQGADTDELSGTIEITGPLRLRCCDEIGHWYQIWGKERDTGAEYMVSEGAAAEMRHIAEAIEGRGGYCAERCAVSASGGLIRLWPPHLTRRWALVSRAAADALAAEIWNMVGRVGERRSSPKPQVREPADLIESDGPITMRHVEVMGDWYALEYQGGLRLTDACVEGTLSEMLLLARAIQARESYSAMRCAVKVEGDRVRLWSPYGSEQKAVVPLAIADALAGEIRSVCADKGRDPES